MRNLKEVLGYFKINRRHYSRVKRKNDEGHRNINQRRNFATPTAIRRIKP